jgi:hypothetical protein
LPRGHRRDGAPCARISICLSDLPWHFFVSWILVAPCSRGASWWRWGRGHAGRAVRGDRRATAPLAPSGCATSTPHQHLAQGLIHPVSSGAPSTDERTKHGGRSAVWPPWRDGHPPPQGASPAAAPGRPGPLRQVSLGMSRRPRPIGRERRDRGPAAGAASCLRGKVAPRCVLPCPASPGTVSCSKRPANTMPVSLITCILVGCAGKSRPARKDTDAKGLPSPGVPRKR